MKLSCIPYKNIIALIASFTLAGCGGGSSTDIQASELANVRIEPLKSSEPFARLTVGANTQKVERDDFERVAGLLPEWNEKSQLSVYCASSLIQRGSRRNSSTSDKMQYWVDSGIWQFDSIPANDSIKIQTWGVNAKTTSFGYDRKASSVIEVSNYARYLSSLTLDAKPQLIGLSDNSTRILFVHTGIPCGTSKMPHQIATQLNDGIYVSKKHLAAPKDSIMGALKYTYAMSKLLDVAIVAPDARTSFLSQYSVSPKSIAYDYHQKEKAFEIEISKSAEFLKKPTEVQQKISEWTTTLSAEVTALERDLTPTALQESELTNSTVKKDIDAETVAALKARVSQLEQTISVSQNKTLSLHSSSPVAIAPQVKVPSSNNETHPKPVTNEDVLRSISGN